MKRSLAAMFLAAAAISALAGEPPGPLAQARLTDLDDRPAEIRRYWGRPLVVNFWARWCGPCRAELPLLAEARARYAPRGAEVLGIALEARPEPVRAFLRVYGVDFPILLAKEGGSELLRALGDEGGGLPFTLVFDRRGREVFRKLGVLTQAEIDAAFAAATE